MKNELQTVLNKIQTQAKIVEEILHWCMLIPDGRRRASVFTSGQVVTPCGACREMMIEFKKEPLGAKTEKAIEFASSVVYSCIADIHVVFSNPKYKELIDAWRSPMEAK